MNSFPSYSFEDIRNALLERHELALLDVREEDAHAQAHPLFAANLPFSRLELDVYARIPRRDTHIVVFDDGEGLAEPAALRLHRLGYSRIGILEGGVSGWREAGGELFRDVNAPSKAFGELVESQRHTPSLTAEEVQALLQDNADVAVLDARRFEEYQVMSIPGGISVPGAELVLRVRDLAPNPLTRVIVNCAGRTRSIIGAQSLINAGIPNPVAALRNGTIGWKLAQQTLAHGQDGRFGAYDEQNRVAAAASARAVADRAGVKRGGRDALERWQRDSRRTTYLFDVRTPAEYEAGHWPAVRSAPGGQLVQETEVFAPVRGARIALLDDDGVRANMTASWLAQMGWEVYVVDALEAASFNEKGPEPVSIPVASEAALVAAATLADWLEQGDTVVLDFTSSTHYVQRHIPGAWFALRSQLRQVLKVIPKAARYVLTCGTNTLARFAAEDLRALTEKDVFVLEGGTAAWIAAGLPLESGETYLASPRIDRYRRPYEGVDSSAEAMQAYLDWEFGLVEQLRRDNTHGFFVI